MREENLDLLVSDIGKDTFDKAFEHVRPLIQGSADAGPCLFEAEVQHALDFCADMFRTAPEDRSVMQNVLDQLSKDQTTAEDAKVDVVNGNNPLKASLDVHAPIMPLAALDSLAQQVHEKSQSVNSSPLCLAQEEARQALAYINARRIVHKDHDGLHNLEEEVLSGFVMRLQIGNLGLEKTSAALA